MREPATDRAFKTRPGGAFRPGPGIHFVIVASLLVVACTAEREDTLADGTSSEVAKQDTKPSDTVAAPGCPAELPLPWVDSRSAACPDLADGTECRYPAPGCTAGELPEHVCTCQDGELQCPPVWTGTCLPVADDGWTNNPAVRPAPKHRATPPTCEALPAATDTACVPDTMGTSTCTTDQDCGAQGRCLTTHTFAGSWDCQCQSNACVADSDCGDKELCNCGVMTSQVQGCDGHGPQCMNDCLPAECRVDADCGDGGLCSPVRDHCDWTTLRYACHHPSKAECLSDAECPERHVCSQADGDSAWSCVAILLCD